MAAPCQPCSAGLSRCHLRRIGSRASVSGIADVIHFLKTVTLIGRKTDVVDYFLSCATPRGSDYISRIHARLIQTNTYELVDSSLTGVYVNDVRIRGRVVLQEGDTVTFGHPSWQSVPHGAWARQPNSPFYFLFEHCHCSLDQMQHLRGELPVPAAAGSSPEARLGLGLEKKKAALPQRAYAAPGALPPCPALSELNVHFSCCHPVAFSTLALPLPSTASAQPPATSLPSTGSVNFSSGLLEMPGTPRLGASPHSSLKGSVRSASCPVRSISPEYLVLEEEMPGPAEPSPQGGPETEKCGSLIQERTKLNGSDPIGGSKEHPDGCVAGSHGLFPHESCSGEAGQRPLQAGCPGHIHSALPASACPEEPVVAELGSSQCGARVRPAGLPQDVWRLPCSCQTGVGGSPASGLPPPSAKELVSSDPDHSQEITKMEIDENPVEMAKSEANCISEPGAQERIADLAEDAVSGVQVRSETGSEDVGEGTMEGHSEIFTEKPVLEAPLQETEPAAEGSGTDSSLASQVDIRAPETPDLLSDSSGSRTPDGLPCGQEPERLSLARSGIAKEISPMAPGTAVPREIPSGRGTCEADSQGRPSEDEGDVELLPQRDTGVLAPDCRLGPKDRGSVETETESDVADDASLGEQSFADVGIQTGGAEEREMGPVLAEAREERGASSIFGVPQHFDSQSNAHGARETLWQQLSEASASDFLTHEVTSKGEFSREGTFPAAASSGVAQGNLSSEDLLETCKEDTTLAAAVPPSGWASRRTRVVLEEPHGDDLLEPPMDVGGRRLEEGPSRRSETHTKGVQEGVVAEREVESGSPGWTGPDPAAEVQLAACRLGHEEGRRSGDGAARSPVCPSLAVPPGVREPDSVCGCESEGPEEADHDGASRGEELEAREGRSVAMAIAAGAAAGEGGLENQPKRLLGRPSLAPAASCGSAGSTLGRGLQGGVACSSGHARRLPPSWLPGDSLEEEEVPHSDDCCAGTLLPSQRREEGPGVRLESENSRLLPKQDDSEDAQNAGLNNETRATAQSCSVGTKPVEDAQQRHTTTEPEEKDSQAERRTDRHASCRTSSGQSTQCGCQEEDVSLPQGCQGTELQAREPQGLENSSELKPQGADVGTGSLSLDELPVEGSAWEESCEPAVAVERITAPGLEGCSEEVVVPEQGSELEQSPKGLRCEEEEGRVSRDLWAPGSEKSRPLRGSSTRHLARESQIDSAVVVLEPSSSDELNLRISDSEVEREAHGASGGEAVVLKDRGASVSPDLVEHLGDLAENGTSCGRQTQPGAAPGQSKAASAESGGGPPKATGRLPQQSSSGEEPCSDLSSATVSVPEASIAEVAVGGKSPPLREAAAAGEEREGRAAGGAELVPLNLSCVSEEVSCLLECNAKLGTEEQAPGGASGAAEEAGSDLLEDCGRASGGLASQPATGTLDVGETPEEHPQRERPAGPCAGEVVRGEAPLPLQQEGERRQPPGKGSRSEEGPGCSARLKSSECGGSPFPKGEESEGCASRKRHFGEGEVLGMVDSEHTSCSRKRLHLLDSGSDLHPSARRPSAPLDLERHRDQFGRTIDKFLQQYGSQISLHSDQTEEKNRDSIARIVRTYFNSTLGLEEPEAENLEEEMHVLPLEAGTSAEADCTSVAKSEAKRSVAGEEKEASLPADAEVQMDQAHYRDPSFGSRCSSTSASSHTEQPGQELAFRIPGSTGEAYFSEEEEEFQSSISSVLEPSFLNSPDASPKAQCGQEACAKNVDWAFSDLSNSSAESEHGDPSPEPEHRSSAGMGSGQLHGMLSEVAVVDLPLGGACRSPEPTHVGWCKQETSALSSTCVSACESVQIPEEDLLEEAEAHLDAVREKTVLRQADGEDGRKAASAEASGWVASCMSSPVGETREELDSHTNEKQIGGDAFLPRSHEDSSSQELECKPPIHHPSGLTLWDRRAACVEVPLAPCRVRELPPEDGDASPSRTAVDTQGEGSVLQSSSLSRVTPSPNQTQACSPKRPVRQDGCAKPVDAAARGELRSREDGASLGPLLSRGPAGVAHDPEEEKGCGEGLESDPGRSGARWTRPTGATNSAARGDAGGPGRSAGPLLNIGVCGNQMPACGPSVQESAPARPQSPGVPSVSRIAKEQPGSCDSHVQVEGFSPCGAHSMACSPVVPVLQKPRIAEASENSVLGNPVGPMDFRNKEEGLLPYQLDEAKAPGRLGAACVESGDEPAPCTEAKKGRSSTFMGSPDASDTPHQGDPWSCEDDSARNARAGSAAGEESSSGKPWASSEQEVAFQLQECQAVLEEISQSLCAVEGIDNLHMEKWREQIAELQKATAMPSTCIAVVGNTGAGKSSLLNALLDEEAVLPTSAMRACTAVVVEISGAAGGRPYEADVEFLTQEEWYKELKVLLEDMKDKSGNLKKRCPDRKTEAGAAYSRVKAVYGRVDEIAELERVQEVTQYLGTVKHISAETAADFRKNIEKFIDSRTDNLRDMKGGEFWPIVKCVKIRVARAEVLKTGVVLVDLPGIRDSNAARDNAAREYLKNCSAVWVVASITRAVDDKTAKDILNSNLRRQLFMDGQFGNLAFICTKTDSFNISDIVRDLDLREEIQPLEEELEELERQRMQVAEEKGTLRLALQPERRQGVEDEDPAWLQRHHDFLEKEFQMSALQKRKDAKLRAISLLCVQARNRFSKQRIRMDFSTGLEELKRKVELSECDDDGDEDMEDGCFAGPDPGDLGEASPQDGKLHVFTVSSTEYLKLSGKLLRDGQAQVFHDPKDTEIPALKNFAIETGLKTSMKATEKVVRDVARVISQIVHYLTNQKAEDVSPQAQAQDLVQQALQDVPRLLQEAADDTFPDIQYCFGVQIQASLSRGSNKAKELCEDTVRSWGSHDYGFPHATYHAVCLRHGFYFSPKYGSVDFNQHLAKPIHDAISAVWSEVFNSKLEESFQRFTKAVLDKLKFFFRELKRKLGGQSSLMEALDALHSQQMEAIHARLCNFILDQEAYISKRQRTISRILTPEVQAGMEPAYAACSQMSGPGYFQRMKTMMESYIRNQKDAVFDAATEKVMQQLHLLQQHIRRSFQSLGLELNKSLRMQFEPLLKPVQKNAEVIPDLMSICAKVDKICKRSCVEYVLPSTTQAEASSPETECELRGSPVCFSALHMDIRLGAVPLPHIAALQVSGQDFALTLTDATTVALPLRSISLCESCLPLGCLILHVPSEFAGEICRRCRVQASSPGRHGQEALVIMNRDQDQTLFCRLMASVSSSGQDTHWQCRYDAEKLQDIPAAVSDPPHLPQVISVVQPSQLPQVNLLLYGRKRAGESSQVLLEKRHKSQAGPDHAGHPLPSWSRESQTAPHGPRASSCPLPTSRVCVPEDCGWKAGWLPGAAQHRMPAGELIARPGSAGAPIRAEEGIWGKSRDPNSKGDNNMALKTEPVESGQEAPPARSSWLRH